MIRKNRRLGPGHLPDWTVDQAATQQRLIQNIETPKSWLNHRLRDHLDPTSGYYN